MLVSLSVLSPILNHPHDISLWNLNDTSNLMYPPSPANGESLTNFLITTAGSTNLPAFQVLLSLIFHTINICPFPPMKYILASVLPFNICATTLVLIIQSLDYSNKAISSISLLQCLLYNCEKHLWQMKFL